MNGFLLTYQPEDKPYTWFVLYNKDTKDYYSDEHDGGIFIKIETRRNDEQI